MLTLHFKPVYSDATPELALWVFDYLSLLDAGLLSAKQIYCGFKTVAELSAALQLQHLSDREYLEAFRPLWQHGVTQVKACISPTFSIYESSYDPIIPASAISDMDNAPALQLNGLSPITEDTPSTSTTTTPSSSTTTRASKSLHQNLITKLRPLPFQYKWAFWYDKARTNTSSPTTTNNDDYTNRLSLLQEEMADIGTFYKVYNNFPWTNVPSKDTVHIFRKGVKPIWEDRENLDGGAWTFRIKRDKAVEFFHEVAILAMANELQAAVQEERDHLLGLSYSVRPYNCHISIWNKHGSNAKSVAQLESTVLERVSPDLRPAAGTYSYKKHSEHEGFAEAVKEMKE